MPLCERGGRGETGGGTGVIRGRPLADDHRIKTVQLSGNPGTFTNYTVDTAIVKRVNGNYFCRRKSLILLGLRRLGGGPALDVSPVFPMVYVAG